MNRRDATGEENGVELTEHHVTAHGIAKPLADLPVASVEHDAGKWQQKDINCHLRNIGRGFAECFVVCHWEKFVGVFILFLLLCGMNAGGV